MLTDRAAMTSATTGTGTITLGSAIASGAQIFQAPGYDTFANSGCIDGQTYSYLIMDVNGGWEYGRGVYTASGTTLTRVPIRSSGGTSAITLSGNEQVFVSLLKEDIRELLLANRTYFVATTGSDSNNGLSSGAAFLTLQKAWNTILTLDLNGFSVTVQIADGTYAAGLSISSPAIGGNVTFQGNNSTPSNVLISTTTTAFTNNAPGFILNINDMKIASSAGVGILANAGAFINYSNIDFGVCGNSHVRAQSGAFIQVNGNYSITGASSFHWGVVTSGIINANTKTITLVGTPAFSTAFANGESTGIMALASVTFSGSATGARYSAASKDRKAHV